MECCAEWQVTVYQNSEEGAKCHQPQVHEPFPALQGIGADVKALPSTWHVSHCLSGLYTRKNKIQESVLGYGS